MARKVKRVNPRSLWRNKFFWPSIFLFLLLPVSISCRHQSSSLPREIIVATTTSLDDSGFLEKILPVFEKETGFKVKPIAVGSGEVLAMGRRGDADLLLVHSPELEADFMAGNYGLRREEFMASDFALVGPGGDPASVKGLSFPEALARIARLRYPFISRGDKSGTHLLETKIWRELGLRPSGAWYWQTGQGMAQTLRVASEKQAYTLTDYPTFHQLRTVLQLTVLSKDQNYQNIYSAIVPRKARNRGNENGGERLLEFLLSSEARQVIISFGSKDGEKEFLFRLIR